MTLIEIVVVITIISMLSAVVAVYATGALVRSRQQTARVSMKNALQALELHRTLTGHYPQPRDGFEPLLASKVLRELPRDPWGNPLAFTLVDSEPMVFSYGADGRPGGEGEDADIQPKPTE